MKRLFFRIYHASWPGKTLLKVISFVLNCCLTTAMMLVLVACNTSIPSTTVRLEATSTPASVDLSIPVATPTSPRITPAYPPPILHSASPQSCLLADLPAGGETPWESPLFAWSPSAQSLVYVEPEETYTYTLMLTVAPQFDTPRRLASNVIGDLFWSPDGSRIAFVAARSDNLETVMTIASDGSGLRDWFPGELAQTDPGKGANSHPLA